MKKLLYTLLCVMIISGCIISRAQTSSATDETSNNDSVIEVIGWFSKNDTAVYWMRSTNLILTESDTTATTSQLSKFRIVVTDSTSEGYKMEYTILDVQSDSIEDSQLSDYNSMMTNAHARKMIGTTVSFETDEMGRIKQFNNLEQLKKRLRLHFQECMKDVVHAPQIKKYQNMGIDVTQKIQDYIDNIDIDAWTSYFLSPVMTIFTCHGHSFPVGEEISFVEATDTEYAYEKSVTAEYLDKYSYYIDVETNSIIPSSELHTFLRSIIDQPTDSKIYDTIISMKGAEMKSYSIFALQYRYDGWPAKILSQDVSTYGSIGKASIVNIILDNIPFLHN